MKPTSAAFEPTVVAIGLEGFRVAVSCETAAVAAVVVEHFAPWVLGVGRHGTVADVTCELAEAGPLADRIVDLQTRLDEEVLRRSTLLPVHAGVVTWRGQAIVLPGVSRSGKTTLVAELVKRGATYFSDEFALLDGHGRVYPYPRPLLVRVDGGSGIGRQPIAASSLTTSIGAAAAPIALILSATYERGAEFRAEPLTASDAVLMLLQHSPSVVGDRPALRGAVTGAVRHATTYRVVRGEAADASDGVLALVQ